MPSHALAASDPFSDVDGSHTSRPPASIISHGLLMLAGQSMIVLRNELPASLFGSLYVASYLCICNPGNTTSTRRKKLRRRGQLSRQQRYAAQLRHLHTSQPPRRSSASLILACSRSASFQQTFHDVPGRPVLALSIANLSANACL